MQNEVMNAKEIYIYLSILFFVCSLFILIELISKSVFFNNDGSTLFDFSQLLICVHTNGYCLRLSVIFIRLDYVINRRKKVDINRICSYIGFKRDLYIFCC